MESRFRTGDRAAFEALARPHLDSVYTLCLRMTHSSSDAEDLAQEALIRALQKHAAYDPGREFRPWLLTITANLCRDHLRMVWWRRILPLGDTETAGGGGPELSAVRADEDQRTRHALSTLPYKYREAMSLYYLDDMTYSEMSQITGASVSALKQRVRRGNAMLRSAIERLYPDLSLRRT